MPDALRHSPPQRPRPLGSASEGEAGRAEERGEAAGGEASADKEAKKKGQRLFNAAKFIRTQKTGDCKVRISYDGNKWEMVFSPHHDKQWRQ